MDQVAPVETIELELLLEAIYRRWGYDFRHYARASIERRLAQFMSASGVATAAEMIPLVLRDREFLSRLVRYFSVPVTEMFRDPSVYRAFREGVVPLLRTWPHVKIWHAGCATGEEVYSLAIVLKEEGLYSRTTIYATDFNEELIERAREGVFEIARIKAATDNYHRAGGREPFSQYYHAGYEAAVMDKSLKERIVFASHNLACDSAFGEMHVVFCRNVLIYFDRTLQNRVLALFTESLARGGFLCLGVKEDLQFTAVAPHYQAVDRKARIYRKVAL